MIYSNDIHGREMIYNTFTAADDIIGGFKFELNLSIVVADTVIKKYRVLRGDPIVLGISFSPIH